MIADPSHLHASSLLCPIWVATKRELRRIEPEHPLWKPHGPTTQLNPGANVAKTVNPVPKITPNPKLDFDPDPLSLGLCAISGAKPAGVGLGGLDIDNSGDIAGGAEVVGITVGDSDGVAELAGIAAAAGTSAGGGDDFGMLGGDATGATGICGGGDATGETGVGGGGDTGDGTGGDEVGVTEGEIFGGDRGGGEAFGVETGGDEVGAFVGDGRGVAGDFVGGDEVDVFGAGAGDSAKPESDTHKTKKTSATNRCMVADM
ncbi:hypothetical protein BVC80_1663g23 [Macleaya cordata]|uniref:Uncharacterized protein n=1 Tax=Macleaya cordata TaxID=56857 RepID=A0A200RBP5_MACCD|nr:hypothetical protein BVC80_1663g23 [Macleaya cordata]